MGLSFDAPPPRGWAALSIIEECLQDYEMAPTMKELAEYMGLRAVSAARRYVVMLEELGYVGTRRTGRRKHIAARSIRLTEKGCALLEQHRKARSSGLIEGANALVLRKRELKLARAAGVPVDSFRQELLEGGGGAVRLYFKDWRERDYWVEQLMEVLGIKGEEVKLVRSTKAWQERMKRRAEREAKAQANEMRMERGE